MPPTLLPPWQDLRITQRAAPRASRPDPACRHLLNLLPPGDDWHAADEAERAQQVLQRKGKTAAELIKEALVTELPDGRLASWLRLDTEAAPFTQHTRLRQALQPLLDEHPSSLSVICHGPAAFRAAAARVAVRVASLNAAPLPCWKSAPPRQPLTRLGVHGAHRLDLRFEAALAQGSALCRGLTLLPPNQLTPSRYRAHLRELAAQHAWQIEEYDLARLGQLEAGAFLAVARGSPRQDAAIVRLRYRGGARHIAVIGKGICFDTGGHNLKPARHMHNMHDDMNGSAVAVGLLLAASRLQLPVDLEVWLAIAENHLSPTAYTQNEVVTALDGTRIEIVHTDAEGRLVLADTLTLAARARPEVILDFATLTGSMGVALGERMSGVFSNRGTLAAAALAAGEASGERVVAFPMPEDYDTALESEVADVKQCTLEGEADHILAARFLQRFVGDRPWLHLDLSASRCKGGLGAVGSDITGFGVAWGLAWLQAHLATEPPAAARPEHPARDGTDGQTID